MGSLANGASRYRVPSIRKRLRRRAGYLKANPAFRQEIERRRQEWDERFPNFAIGDPGLPPVKPRYRPPVLPPYPDKLLDAAGEWNRRLARKAGSTLADELALEAMTSWDEMLQEIALSWWPLKYYPVFDHVHYHPALRFVAGCLLYRIANVPDDWVNMPALAPIPQFGSPAMPNDAEVVALRQERDHIVQRLDEALDAGTTITVEVVNEILREAWVRGTVAYVKRYDEIADAVGGKGTFLMFPVFPGLTHEDWTQARPTVFRFIQNHYGGQPLEAAACELCGAGLLGLSRDTVRRWTKAAATLAK